MLTVRSILCPIDFSEQSRQALRWAAAIAQHRGVELTVLSVVEPLLAQAAGIRLGVDVAPVSIEPELPAFVETTFGEGVRQPSRLRMEVRVGDPSDAILETARRQEAGLIVMGTHGRSGLRKLVLGSTTERVLRRTEWPVLAVPGEAVRLQAGAPLDAQLKTILLATDFRNSTAAATRWAADLAVDIGAPLVLAHVVEPVIVPGQGGPALAADFEGDRVASGQRMLASLASSSRGGRTECVVSVGHPGDTIASLAREYRAGLVVMGLAYAEDPEARTPGSIAYRVLHVARIAVVVVPEARPKALATVSHRWRRSLSKRVRDFCCGTEQLSISTTSATSRTRALATAGDGAVRGCHESVRSPVYPIKPLRQPIGHHRKAHRS